MNPTTRETASLPDDLLDQQRQRWMNGENPSVESLLVGTPYADDREVQLDLIYHEIVIRDELQLPASPEDFGQRFPHLKSDLDLHFEIHHALVREGLVDTNDAHAEESWPESRPLTESVPESIGAYDIERELGRGGMAVVYLARHRQLRRWVALKTFRKQLTTREFARVRTEAEAIARLTHRNIVQIYEIGDEADAPWIALEYADQGTLAQKLSSSTYNPAAAAELIETLARALQHAHSLKIVHRDLKPANILLTAGGEPKITDFGLVKVLDAEDNPGVDVTRTGEAIGTPRYMAPEQASGNPSQIGPHTDVYALGTILYECLTGRPPFVSSSVVDTLRMITSDDPIPPRRLQPGIPRDLETICLQCLQKSPERRYSTAQALADDLRRFRMKEPITARPTPSWERLWKWCRRRPALASLIALVGLLAVGALSGAVVMQRMETRRIHDLRTRVAELTTAGRQQIESEEYELAQARFQEAWQIVQSEPALFDHETSVAGWLDHTRNAINRYHWTQRVPPREFDELRDSAIFESALVVPHLKNPVPLVRDSIEHARSLTPPDAAWDSARDQLTLLDIEMRDIESGPESALAELDRANISQGTSQYMLRAQLLQKLGRSEESQHQRQLAQQLPPRKAEVAFQFGLALIRQQNFQEAENQFQQTLDLEPEHFLARLLQGVCCLRLNQLPEARIAMTAAIAQRPRFHWSYLFRSQVHRLMGDWQAAKADLEFALSCRPSDPESYSALVELGQICREHGDLDTSRQSQQHAERMLPNEPAALELGGQLDGGAP